MIKHDKTNKIPQKIASCPEHRLDGQQSAAKTGGCFIAFLLIMLGLSLVVVQPILYGIAWGCMFAFLWRPVHSYLMKKPRLARYPNITAGISFTLLLLTFTIPLVYTIQAVLGEVFSAYEAFMEYVAYLQETGFYSIQNAIPEAMRQFTDPILKDRDRIASMLTSLAQSTLNFLQGLSKGVLHWTGAFMFQGLIALMTMFFMIRDGEALVGYIKDFIPLGEDKRDLFLEKTGKTMNSVVYGVVMTVGVQAILGGIGWRVAGLPNSFLASAAMFIFGMLPMGTSVVWVPGGIYLIAAGQSGWGIALLIWGFVVVSSIDNVLRPIFIGGDSSLPALAIIIGLTGGLAIWGLIGVFLGPMVLALSLSLLDMYRAEVKAER